LSFWQSPRGGGLVALAVIIGLLPLVLPNNYFFNVAILIGLNGIVCIGLNLLIGYAGQISLGHAGFFGLGAYVAAILTSNYAVPPLAAMLLAALLVGILAFAVARPIMRLKGHYLAMGTLGLGIIIAIVLNQEVELTGGPDGMPVDSFSLLGWQPYGDRVWYWIVGVLLLVTVWLALNLIDSPVGRALRALHGSEVAAASAGINVVRFKVQIFVTSAILASLAGSVFAFYIGFITPGEANFLHSLELVAMVVLGGLASIYGALVGAAILTILPQVLTVFHDYEMMMLGAIMMAVMIFMRRGLVPTLAKLLRRRGS
jgi:branched-chain amino acid transport system permease protein